MILHLSEDEIRSKIVYQWLKDIGFLEKQIRIEYSFNIRIGKSIKLLHPRTDVLVKAEDERNLLIVEVKKPGHNLSKGDKDQAISYARLLTSGIAPFTILTNGIETKIYDSISGEEVDKITATHPYVKNEFKVTGDFLKIRSEALEYLISLSSENLIGFCKAQVEYRMELLKSDDIFSGKKYIPSLYIERTLSKNELTNKLFPLKKEDQRSVLLVIGPPQHGKTCFLCSTVEHFLNEENPCLFYPAVALKGSLINEIKEDFGFYFNQGFENWEWLKRVNKIAKGLGKRFFIFVDGWNEMIANAFYLNEECKRMDLEEITIIVSTTTSSLNSLLKDSADNLCYIAEKVGLTDALIRSLETKTLRETERLGIVQIQKFSEAEFINAKINHEKIYETKFTRDDNLLYDPFYLRLASELYSGCAVPTHITSTELVWLSLLKKSGRRNIDQVKLSKQLNELGALIFVHDRKVDAHLLPNSLADTNSILPWTEAAILIILQDKGSAKVDFYYTHDLNYTIAIIVRKWQLIFETHDPKILNEEIKLAERTEAGQSALYWFFCCKEYYRFLRRVFENGIFEQLSPSIQSILCKAVLMQVTQNEFADTEWLHDRLDQLAYLDIGEEEILKEKFPELLFAFLKSLDATTQKELFLKWLKVLIAYDYTIEDVGVEESLTYELLSEKWGELKSWGEDESDSALDERPFVEILREGTSSAIDRAAFFLAETKPDTFLSTLKQIKTIYDSRPELRKCFEHACWVIIENLTEGYYGSMCPGWFDGVERGDEDIKEEFYKQKDRLRPIGFFFQQETPLIKEVNGILLDLHDMADLSEPFEKYLPSPNQLQIDF